MSRLRWGPLAFALSAIALFVALGGTGWALTQGNGSQPANRSALSTRALPAWHSLGLTGGWTYGGYGTYHAAYYKDSQGVVHLRGSAAGGGGSVFRLPSGARPAHTLYLPVYAFDGSAGGMEIDPDGRAYLFDASPSGNANVTGFTSFEGISFRVP